MLKSKYIITIVFFFITGSVFAAPKSVAVLNFSNYGGEGLSYLSNSLPETVSASLSDHKNIRVVERRNLGKLLNEIALGQTGIVNTQGIDRVGKIIKADILILGSISGDPENIIVTLKAVDVETGKVIDGKIVKGHLRKIFDLVSQAAHSIGGVIGNEGLGKLSISTNPSGADIYIDGIQVGTAPLVEYRLIKGKHRLKVVKNGFMDYDKDINVKIDGHIILSPVLVESRRKNFFELGGGASYFAPAWVPSDIQANAYYYFFFGYTFNKVKIELELGFASLDHNQTYTFFGVNKLAKRQYSIFNLLAEVIFIPFDWRYVSPYIGGFAGYTNINETNGFTSGNGISTSTLSLGASTGFIIMPYSRISLNIDGKFFYYPIPFSRDIYGQTGIGPLNVVDTQKFNIKSFTIGGSVKFNF